MYALKRIPKKVADLDGLTGNGKPTHYNLELRGFDLNDWTYAGSVAIHAELTGPSKSIIIHAGKIKLKDAQVFIDDSLAATCSSFNYNKKAQLVELHLDNELSPAKEATISISFACVIGDSLTGFYRAKYSSVVKQAASVKQDDDGSYYAPSTQFQLNNARQAFPCFDVPNLKAKFDFSIEVPSDQVALCNMSAKTTTPATEPVGTWFHLKPHL